MSPSIMHARSKDDGPSSDWSYGMDIQTRRWRTDRALSWFYGARRIETSSLFYPKLDVYATEPWNLRCKFDYMGIVYLSIYLFIYLFNHEILSRIVFLNIGRKFKYIRNLSIYVILASWFFFWILDANLITSIIYLSNSCMHACCWCVNWHKFLYFIACT